MKKSLLLLLCTVASLYVRSQCVSTCSAYALSPITYSVFPATGPNVTSSFLPNTDDGATGAIPIGFTFQYYCNNYTDVYICSNGFIQFTPVSWAHGNFVHSTSSIPDVAEPNNGIYFNMTDLNPGVGGSVSYATIGTAPNRQFIVTFTNVPCFSSSDLNSGQIVLYETTNVIEIHTGTAFGDLNQTNKGTQGIENLNGTAGVPVTLGNVNRNNNSGWFSPSQVNNTAYRFTSAYAPLAPTAITGNTILCQGDIESYQATFISSALSYSWSGPPQWTGTSTLSSITYTSGVSGVMSVSATYTCGTSPATTLFINANPAPVISITQVTPGIFCSGTTVTITTSGADTYTIAPSGMQGFPPFTDVPLASIVYSASGTSTNGCLSTTPATVLVSVLTTPTVSVNSGAVCQGEQFTINASGANTYNYASVFPVITQTTPGVYSYTVVGTATNGCQSEVATSNLTVNPLPNVTAGATRTAICKGETTGISAGGAVSYVWTHTTATTASMVVNPTFNNQYAVTGTDANGCKRSANVSVLVSPCAGVAEQANVAGHFIATYPNPVTNQLSVEITSEALIEIFDVNARLIWSAKMQEGTHQVNTALFPTGIYYLKATSENRYQSLIIVKD